MKMTLHRALSELKLIDSKIEKAINALEPIGMMQTGKLVNGFTQKEEFEKEALSRYQSVTDLIERKRVIKSKIVMANVLTKVLIGDKEMTISEAINFKTLIELKKKLIRTLMGKLNVVRGKYLQENAKVNEVALGNAKIMLGKEGDSRVKATDEDVRNIVEPFVKRNEHHLVDPLGLEKLIEALQAEVEEYETEVDSVLSEINAVTLIEIQ